ncbi:MAG: hypothetical protein KIS73_22780 [Enhydrobacter sp.]|nr:hypothetical protein [Enhydrobacter sp.]
MTQSSKLDELIAALDALPSADHDAVMRRLRQKPRALPEAAVVVTNLGKGEADLTDGGPGVRPLAAGSMVKLEIPPLPLARGAALPAVPDSSGLPTAPKSLVSLRMSSNDKSAVELRIDLGGWIANAPRCGWPFAFHRQPEKKAGSAWRIEAAPAFTVAVRKTAPVDLVVIGLGVDLSDLAERFALLFDRRPPDGSKADAT